MRWLIALAFASVLGCDDPSAGEGGGDAEVPDVLADAASAVVTWSAADVAEDGGPLVFDERLVVVEGALRVEVVDVAPGTLISVEAAADAPLNATVADWEATEREANAVWWRARPADEGALTVSVTDAASAEVRLRVVARARPPDATRDRSLVWTDPALVDDPAAVGLEVVMRAAAAGHGGALLDDWLRRFATTPHSERPALADFADHLRATYGEDPATWDISALPFRVTAVHNRLDLRNDEHCGELRVSLNVTDESYPFIHFLFLFAQQPGVLDRSLTGALHCEDVAFRWAWLSDGDDEAFRARARDVLDAGLVPASFLMAESLERSVGTWEWRQWKPGGTSFENPPLFQTVDVERLGAPGPERDDLLSWVAREADAIAQRRALVPSRFAPLSARATEGVPRATLDLAGLDPSLDAEGLARRLDTIGCPGCHARSPTFLQTNADRTFSPFYEDELVARAAALDSFRNGAPTEAPFGALSD